MEVVDTNEFSPEFERLSYSFELSHLFNDQLDSRALDLSHKPADPQQLKHSMDASNVELDNSEADPEMEQEAEAEQGVESGSQRDRYLFQVRARDQDCSHEFGLICRYELIGLAPTNLKEPQSQAQQQSQQQQQSQSSQTNPLDYFRIDQQGRVWLVADRPRASLERGQFSFQALAYDCGGKKSQLPANIHIQMSLEPKCQPTLKGKYKRLVKQNAN